ncbi:MAG: hypothetical protein K940chlam7_00061 [Chlamydiae bacterium]|nr:hypothetical protein [Chlamydiota bacterium]
MRPPDFMSCTVENAAQYAAKVTPEELEPEVQHMTLEQIPEVFVQINEEHDAKWKDKTRAAILGLNERPKLEAAGKTLTPEQTMELIDKTLQIEDKHHWKLGPLLVGMPHETFSQLILQASEQQLHVLKHEGVTEPIQHQLTTLSHEITRQIEQMENEIDIFASEIDRLEIDTLSREDVSEMFHRIHLYAEFFQRLFNKTNIALSIAWNTKRLDLIEALNHVKDSCQKYSVYGVGKPTAGSSPATGLFANLEGTLFKIYGDPEDPNDLEAVQDKEPAMEALAKLSVWYLRDYLELGLLPEVKNREDLDLDMKTHTENERAEYREKLFSKVKQNLGLIDLLTVRNLKSHYIFSRKTLEEYIHHYIIDKA